MSTKLTQWKIGDFLKSEDDQILYLIASMEEADDDRSFFQKAIQDIARAKQLNLEEIQLYALVEKILEITAAEKILTQDSAARFIRAMTT